jgi:hypothetical protein
MTRLASIVLAVSLVAAPLGASAQSSPISPGMELSGTINQSISSANAYAGEPFTVSNVTDTSGSGRIVGATIYGHVTGVTKPGLGRNARVRLAFDHIVLRSGRRYALDARPLHIRVMTKNNAGREAGGAIVGDLLGNFIGKTLGVALLGPIGLVGGFLVAKNARQNVVIPSNSLVTLQVLRAYRQG